MKSEQKSTEHLRDFTATPRMLQLAAMAAVTGTMGAAAAWALLELIAFFTNLAYFGRLKHRQPVIVARRIFRFGASPSRSSEALSSD